jgi:catechol 2,3-dioxygenase-like lactoylglutathione lyase family enzyme
MEIKRVDHYSIRTLDLEAARRFYTDVIGLKEGPRPPFDFPGYWLYSGEPPADLSNAAKNYGLVHLMGPAKGLTEYLGDKDAASLKGGTGPLDHVAFAATGRDAMVERCKSHRIEFFERDVPLLGIRQMFVKDPDGVTIELNYPASEAPQKQGAQAAGAAR